MIAPSNPVPPAGERAMVLVIEDVANVVRTVKASLEDLPVEIVSTAIGGAGLDMIRKRRPMLVLLDLALPDMSGWDVLTAVRNDPELTLTPVVIMTAMGDSETAKLSQLRGADGFMAKPFKPERLRRMVDHFLQAA